MNSELAPEMVFQKLKSLFSDRFSYDRIVFENPDVLFEKINQRVGSVDSNIEGFLDPSKQRDLTLKFHWGHNHDFGNGISYSGRMGDRHISIISRFVTDFGLPLDLAGKRILDIGVWTGGTSLLLAAMGASVVALEEVVKYSETVNLLASAFGLQEQVRCLPISLYEALAMFADEFDYVIYSGVIYHVSDPLLSLRLVFGALKDEGVCFLETYGIDSTESICRYDGPEIVHEDGSSREQLNRGGWNYFLPSKPCLERWCGDVGFEQVNVAETDENSRILGSARRRIFHDFCRAGFSRIRCR